jgi:hypothetical protein
VIVCLCRGVQWNPGLMQQVLLCSRVDPSKHQLYNLGATGAAHQMTCMLGRRDCLGEPSIGPASKSSWWVAPWLPSAMMLELEGSQFVGGMRPTYPGPHSVLTLLQAADSRMLSHSCMSACQMLRRAWQAFCWSWR